MTLDELILIEAEKLFIEKGIKFTMDDLAANLGISKKTIYAIYEDRSALITALCEYIYANVNKEKKVIYADKNLSNIEKIKTMLMTNPAAYKGMDFANLYVLTNKYPEAYAIVEKGINDGWKLIKKLYDAEIKAGNIKADSFGVFRMTFSCALEHIVMENDLKKFGLKQKTALSEMIDLLLCGVLK